MKLNRHLFSIQICLKIFLLGHNPSCRHQSQSRIFSLQISGCRVHTTHSGSSLPDAESSRLLRISSGKARLKLRSPYTETPGPCWKACICECMVHRE